MSEGNSTAAAVAGKPAKPYPNFPLFRHATGQWAKKIRGRMRYFGTDPDAALAKYLKQKDELHAGRTPRADTGEPTVKDVCYLFEQDKKALVESGELSPRTLADYKRVVIELARYVGKSRLVIDLGPADFAGLRRKMAKKWGPHRLQKLVQYVRSIFKHAKASTLIDQEPAYGPEFKRPSAAKFRLHRDKKGPKLFTREQILALLDAAGPTLKAMILLGINCGFGNSDCGTLPLKALDIDAGWIAYPRPKTGIKRRCPLWPETVEAIRDALANRPEPKHASGAALVFVTKYGGSWAKATADNPVSQEMRKLLKEVSSDSRESFYALRHTFRTVADEAKDQPAADYIMGHVSPGIASTYRQTISDERLRAVADTVRTWLFGKPLKRSKAGRRE